MTHIGIIRALEENNIPIDYITGTSMGAIIGSLYAMGYLSLIHISLAMQDRARLLLHRLHRRSLPMILRSWITSVRT